MRASHLRATCLRVHGPGVAQASVPIFKATTTQVMLVLVSKMKAAIYCPKEFVIRQDTFAKGLFLITRGLVHVLKRPAAGGEPKLIVALADSDFFGERSLVTEERASASVRSVSYTDISVLLRADFKRVADLFPEVSRLVTDAACQKRQQERASEQNRRKSTSIRVVAAAAACSVRRGSHQGAALLGAGVRRGSVGSGRLNLQGTSACHGS